MISKRLHRADLKFKCRKGIVMESVKGIYISEKGYEEKGSLMKKTGGWKEKIIPVAVILVLLLIWQLACHFEWVPSFMLPSPLDVINAL